MSNPIQLTPVDQPVQARAQLTPEQVQSLISVIASVDPAVIALPEGKTFADVRTFHLVRHGDKAALMVSIA